MVVFFRVFFFDFSKGWCAFFYDVKYAELMIYVYFFLLLWDMLNNHQLLVLFLGNPSRKYFKKISRNSLSKSSWSITWSFISIFWRFSSFCVMNESAYVDLVIHIHNIQFWNNIHHNTHQKSSNHQDEWNYWHLITSKIGRASCRERV